MAKRVFGAQKIPMGFTYQDILTTIIYAVHANLISFGWTDADSFP